MLMKTSAGFSHTRLQTESVSVSVWPSLRLGPSVDVSPSCLLQCPLLLCSVEWTRGARGGGERPIHCLSPGCQRAAPPGCPWTVNTPIPKPQSDYTNCSETLRQQSIFIFNCESKQFNNLSDHSVCLSVCATLEILLLKGSPANQITVWD